LELSTIGSDSDFAVQLYTNPSNTTAPTYANLYPSSCNILFEQTGGPARLVFTGDMSYYMQISNIHDIDGVFDTGKLALRISGPSCTLTLVASPSSGGTLSGGGSGLCGRSGI